MDQPESLGIATYQPFLGNPSDSVAGVLQRIHNIYFSDSVFNQQDISILQEGDSVFIELNGRDENPYSMDMTVALLKNTDNGFSISPLLTETSDTSGVFRSKAVLGTSTNFNTFMLKASLGDSLTLAPLKNPSLYAWAKVGEDSSGNSAPVITSSDSAMATEDIAFSFDIIAQDAETTPSFSIDALPDWLTLNGTTLQGTPREGDETVGIRIVASDGQLIDNQTLWIVVQSVNDAPVYTGVDSIVAVVDQQVFFTPTAMDVDGDVVCQILVKPSWLALEGDTLWGTPSVYDADSGILVGLNDGEIFDSVWVPIHVFNSPPRITSYGVFMATLGERVAFCPKAVDSTGTVTFSSFAMPPWLSWQADSIVGVAPSRKDTSFLLIASDGVLADTMEMVIDLDGVGHYPLISSDSVMHVVEDSSFVYLSQTLTDSTETTIQYLNYPSWTQVMGRHLKGTPLNEHQDTCFILTAEVNGVRDSLNVSILISYVNDAPVLAAMSDTLVMDVGLMTRLLSITDVDSPLDSMVVSVSSSDSAVAPQNSLQVVIANGQAELQFMPLQGVYGSSQITLVVSDGFLSDTADFQLTVVPVDSTWCERFPSKCGVFTDSRDGQSYDWVELNGQIWMAENLNYKYGSEDKCYDKTWSCEDCGRLYAWPEAQYMCPTGWHMPSKDEWIQFAEFVQSEFYTSPGTCASGLCWNLVDHLLQLGTWSSVMSARNSTSFSAKPCGYGIQGSSTDNATYEHKGDITYFWSTSFTNSGYTRTVMQVDEDPALLGVSLDRMMSIRCIKTNPWPTSSSSSLSSSSVQNQSSSSSLSVSSSSIQNQPSSSSSPVSSSSVQNRSSSSSEVSVVGIHPQWEMSDVQDVRYYRITGVYLGSYAWHGTHQKFARHWVCIAKFYDTQGFLLGTQVIH